MLLLIVRVNCDKEGPAQWEDPLSPRTNNEYVTQGITVPWVFVRFSDKEGPAKREDYL